MRELWTWIGIVLVVVFLAAILWWRPVYAAEPTGSATMDQLSCVSSTKLTHDLEEHGLKAWPLEGLSAVRFLSILNHIDPPTDYRAESIVAAFSPSPNIGMAGIFLFNEAGCASKEQINIPIKTAIAVMRETFAPGAKESLEGRKITRVHDIYTGVRGKNGQLCCGGTDCNRVEYRMRDDGAEFLVGGDPWGTPKEWIFIKTEQITFLPVPGDVTGDAHFCGRLATPEELALHGPRIVGRYWFYCAFIPPGGV